jgi:cyclopropane fatty-acyl-phospholipid synthase-like methyltransferase
VLDIGCGWGVAALEAARSGAMVIANDLDTAGLDSLKERAAAAGFEDRIEPLTGRFPAIVIADGSLDAVLAASILHFLKPRDLEAGLLRIATWLRPGGKFFALAATPYLGPFARFVPEYRERVAAEAEWPGWIARTRDFSAHRLLGHMPAAVHLLDDAVLGRAARAAGLSVERVWMFRRRDLPASLWLDGRESAGLIAARPG